MIVCSQGEVTDFCENHDMLVVERYEGDPLEYCGNSIILVTDREMSEVEYYFTKMALRKKGVELVSVYHKDEDKLISYMNHRQKNGGRYKFGFQSIDGIPCLTEKGRAVVKRIFELRDEGHTYRSICHDEGVCHPDGRRLNISAVQLILKNRKVYEREML